MNSFIIYFLISLICCVSSEHKSEICAAEDIADTNIEHQTYINSEPIGLRSGLIFVFKKFKVKSDNDCVKHCCSYKNCTGISIVRNICLLFNCTSKEACKPTKISNLGERIVYITLLEESTKQDITISPGGSQYKKQFDEDSQICELSVEDNCPANSVCKRIQEDRRSGICVCITGYVKKSSSCIEDESSSKIDDRIESFTIFLNISSFNLTTVIPMTKKTKVLTQNITTMKVYKIPETTIIVEKVTKPSVIDIVVNAGPDLHIKLTNPQLSSTQEIVTIRGSAFNRKGIPQLYGINYEWLREPKSLAVGSILNNSDHSSTLILTSLLCGQYIFMLTVTDNNGVKSSDSVNIFVTEKADNNFNNLVDVLCETNVFKFTEQESINFSLRMGHLIEKNLKYTNCQVHVISVIAVNKNRTLISFYAESIDPNTKEFKIIQAGILEENLKMKLTKHKFIFDYSISKFQSRVCFNTCGGHGKCSFYSHRCKCHLPWINNPWRERSTGFSNCDMHVVLIAIVCVASIFMTALLFLTLKTLFRKCQRRSRFSKETLRYKLLDNSEP